MHCALLEGARCQTFHTCVAAGGAAARSSLPHSGCIHTCKSGLVAQQADTNCREREASHWVFRPQQCGFTCLFTCLAAAKHSMRSYQFKRGREKNLYEFYHEGQYS